MTSIYLVTAACTSAILIKSLVTFHIEFLEDGHDLGLSVRLRIVNGALAMLICAHFGTSFQQPANDLQVTSGGREMEGRRVVPVLQVDIHALPRFSIDGRKLPINHELITCSSTIHLRQLRHPI